MALFLIILKRYNLRGCKEAMKYIHIIGKWMINGKNFKNLKTSKSKIRMLKSTEIHLNNNLELKKLIELS